MKNLTFKVRKEREKVCCRWGFRFENFVVRCRGTMSFVFALKWGRIKLDPHHFEARKPETQPKLNTPVRSQRLITHENKLIDMQCLTSKPLSIHDNIETKVNLLSISIPTCSEKPSQARSKPRMMKIGKIQFYLNNA